MTFYDVLGWRILFALRLRADRLLSLGCLF